MQLWVRVSRVVGFEQHRDHDASSSPSALLTPVMGATTVLKVFCFIPTNSLEMINCILRADLEAFTQTELLCLTLVLSP